MDLTRDSIPANRIKDDAKFSFYIVNTQKFIIPMQLPDQEKRRKIARQIPTKTAFWIILRRQVAMIKYL
jgi:hypothetical protein